MNCEQVEELAGAYALDALPPAEAAAVESHLASCDRHPEIAELQAVAATLATAAEPMQPPPALKSRLMAAVREESPQAAPAPSAGPGILQRLFGQRFAPYTLAAGLAVAVIALAGWNVYLQTSASSDSAVVSSISAGSVSGRVVYLPGEDTVFLSVDGLSDLPAERAYQAWAITGGLATSLGVLSRPQDGRLDAAITGVQRRADTIAVTIEPAGGSDQPTSTPLLSADL